MGSVNRHPPRRRTASVREKEESEESSPAHGGRPLDPSRHAAILEAALEGLAELGYNGLTMDEIAARAHAGKGALYRRWRSKAALLVDAVIAWRESWAPLHIADTGSLIGDIQAMIDAIPDFDDAAWRQIGVFYGLATAAGRDSELRQAIAANIFGRPRRVLTEVFERAMARGEIPTDRDLELIADVVLGLNFVRLSTGRVPDRDYLTRVFTTVVYPLLTGQPYPTA